SAINKHAPEATPKAIAEELVVTRGNITGVLNRLHERELIDTRQHATDGRSFVCELTGQGQALLKRARAGAGAFIRQQLSMFDDDELQLTMHNMQRMEAHLREMNPDAIVAAECVATYDNSSRKTT
ncbi:MAG: MarR family transcriptional regulator, partial [Myxococcota bacterium]